ncbi:hypothetical protein Adi01nite_79230 [Amorphoplanes digitatis]|uniref:Thrombospondin n=1 Tax=Actinoplanes digitatis TaxID=1868 RepID=A0A7W7HSU4_9ACTN|nr:hypothetical protein [Actinoplanes digitatis]MBB4760094.1 hypothetical protein [Actinoplanes digitatis]GID98511.1 hypothetical protein Adi01nite_79230 [Actinoplanes digitatis]
MKLPTFSRQSDTTDRPSVATGSTDPVRPRTDPPTDPPTVTPPPATPPTVVERRRPAEGQTLVAPRDTDTDTDTDLNSRDLRPPAREPVRPTTERPPVVAGPKPRASLLATLGLIVSVAATLLVLSGPLLGYGIGLAVVGLVLSLCGISATGKRHVAGKTDALIGVVLSLGAIVVGVFALTGSLSWLGTDTQPVTSVREWLDAQVVNRF